MESVNSLPFEQEEHPKTNQKRTVPQKKYILEPWTDYLKEHLEGFDQIQWKLQFALASLAYDLDTKRRKHDRHKGFYTVSHQELKRDFGSRGFHPANKNLEMFVVTNWSKKDNSTRAFKLSPQVSAIRNSFLSKEPAELAELVDETGKILRKLPKFELDKEVSITKRKYTNVCYKVRPNRYFLSKLITQLRKSIHLGADLQLELDCALKLRKRAYTKVSGRNVLHERYHESPAGRLYAKETSLQNAPKCVSSAIMTGYIENDFENCHYSMFSQLAARINVTCEHIDFYLKNKKGVREAIASDIGLSVSKVKVSLIAIMYGAKPTTWHDAAIPKKILQEDAHKATALYAHKYFAGILSDIKKARKAIIEQWPDVTQRSYVNALGKKISKKEGDKFVMAFLMQGLEGYMLRIAMDQCHDVVALKHDGFVTVTKPDTRAVCVKIRDELDLRMEIDTTLIQTKQSKKAVFALKQEQDKEKEQDKTRQAGMVRQVLTDHLSPYSPVTYCPEREKSVNRQRHEFFQPAQKLGQKAKLSTGYPQATNTRGDMAKVVELHLLGNSTQKIIDKTGLPMRTVFGCILEAQKQEII